MFADIAEGVGLESNEIRTAVADGELRDRLRERFTEAQRDGITGIPTFTYDVYAARGAVPPEELARLVEGT